ncbi:MAG: DUF4270 domain-containing protein [Bacteroidales bacterium]|nr:DUF4270 domain-containing protein [Bacteroidales bacterium]
MQVDASFVCEFSPIDLSDIQKLMVTATNVVVDSVSIYLQFFNRYAGQEPSEVNNVFYQNLNVYSLSEKLPHDTIRHIYSSSKIGTDKLIARHTFDQESSYINFNADTAFGAKFLKDFIDDTTKKFIGLYFEADQVNGLGAINYVNLFKSDPQNGLYKALIAIGFHYNNAKNERDTSEIILSSSRGGNYFRASKETFVQHIKGRSDQLYIQGITGAQVRFAIPGFQSFANNLKAQNKK